MLSFLLALSRFKLKKMLTPPSALESILLKTIGTIFFLLSGVVCTWAEYKISTADEWLTNEPPFWYSLIWGVLFVTLFLIAIYQFYKSRIKWVVGIGLSIFLVFALMIFMSSSLYFQTF